MRRKLAAGNWKMNGSVSALDMIAQLAQTHATASCDVLLCPPALFLFAACDRASGGPVTIGAQTCHAAAAGAHTGDISAQMVAETGATHVIVGHSERREGYGETDSDVQAKASAAQAAGLVAIVCLGESLAQREAGEALPVIRAQLKGSVPAGSTGADLVVAYEPIWAIGTGKTASAEDAQVMCASARATVADLHGSETAASVRIQYGGSVKPANANELLTQPDIDGALVGGASLDADSFAGIIQYRLAGE